MSLKDFDWLKWILLVVFLIAIAVVIKSVITGSPK